MIVQVRFRYWMLDLRCIFLIFLVLKLKLPGVANSHNLGAKILIYTARHGYSVPPAIKLRFESD